MDFTAEQNAVINHHSGNCVVIAGAGSGKTRCLVERTASLLEAGEDAERILLFTFTKKAANEIASRIIKRMDYQEESKVHTSTIHSLALTIFREHTQDIGYSTDKVTLWDPSRRAVSVRRLIRETMTECKDPFDLEIPEEELRALQDGYVVDDTEESTDDAKFISYQVDLCKSIMAEFPPIPTPISGISPRQYFENLMEGGSSRLIATVCTYFLASKNACSVIEYDDMIPGACKALRELGTDWVLKFRHVMCDEYQDVNDINVEFLRLLCGPNNQSLMVVGDDDQAIYGFRGANTEHILSFPTVFEGTVLYLTRNFRSAVSIVELANKIILNNQKRYDKEMVPHKKDAGTVMTVEPFLVQNHSTMYGRTRYDQYLDVFRLINGFIHFVGMEPKEIAILARNNYNLTLAHSAFRSRNRVIKAERSLFEQTGQKPQNGILHDEIPFAPSSLGNLFQTKLIRKVMDILTIFVNPSDYITAREVFLSSVDGFGNRTAEYFVQEASTNPDQTIFESLRGVTAYPRHGSHTKKGKKLWAYADRFEKTVARLDSDRQLVSEYWVEAVQLSGIEEDIDKMQSNIKDQRKGENYRETLLQIREWVFQFAKSHPPGSDTLKKMLDEIATEVTQYNTSERNEVELMTIHGSKGKEWKAVFLIDIDSETLPSPRAEDIEEERRIFYVGITRAAESLIICRSNEGSEERDLQLAPPSAFWLETGIPPVFDR